MLEFLKGTESADASNMILVDISYLYAFVEIKREQFSLIARSDFVMMPRSD